jgi:CRISPR/Cas system-associated exonuclease Cas4 (RecB family)
MDETFKNYFDEYRQTGELPPEIAGRIDAKLFDDMEKLDIWRNINFGRGGFKAEFPEYGIAVSGAIDELLVAPDGKYIPIDFKTRGYAVKEDTHEHYRHQLDFYALLFEKNGLPPARFGYLLFFWPQKYGGGKADFKTELVEMDISSARAGRILKQVREILDSSKPPAHSDCEYCRYREAGQK